MDPEVRAGLARSWKALMAVGIIAIVGRLRRDPRPGGRLGRDRDLHRLDSARSPAPS